MNENEQLIEESISSFRIQSQQQSQQRSVHFQQNQCSEPENRYCDNKIQTTKYTKYEFIPYSFFYQLTQMTNLYFFFNGIFQCFNEISTNNPFASFIPLFCIISIGILKEGYVEYKRYQHDEQTNQQRCECYSQTSQRFQIKKWQDIKVAEIIKVYNKEIVPADMILLSVSDMEGVAYCSTATLDGERSLKPKMANKEIQDIFN